jgi:hypothetical protein
MLIHSFIFNWRGQYEKTKEKEKILSSIPDVKVTVINSDEEHMDEDWINIGEESFFTDQFMMALKLFSGDIFWHVQGDASYDKWSELVTDAKKYWEKYEWGIYAPNVDYTWYTANRTDISGLLVSDTNLKIVACTDCTCWFIHKDVIQDFKDRNIDMTPYTMGWGWDIVLPSLAFLKQKPVFRDYNHVIQHPEGTNYNKDKAEREMLALFESLPLDLKKLFSHIKSDRESIAKYFNE